MLVGDLMNAFDGVKVFSATQEQPRGELGERVTDWMASHPEISVVEIRVTQSSDSSFHCIALIVFYKGALRPSLLPTITKRRPR